MNLALRQFPYQPSVYRTHKQLSPVGGFTRAVNVVEYPFNAACSEIRVDKESAAFPYHLCKTALAQVFAYICTSLTLPNDGVIDGLAAKTVPYDHRLALVSYRQRI